MRNIHRPEKRPTNHEWSLEFLDITKFDAVFAIGCPFTEVLVSGRVALVVAWEFWGDGGFPGFYVQEDEGEVAELGVVGGDLEA